MPALTDPPVPVVALAYTTSIDSSAQNVFVFNGSASITQASFEFPQAAATIVFWLNAAPATDGVLLSYAGSPSSNPGRLWVKNPGNLQAGVGPATTGATGINCADGAWHQLAITLQQADANTVSVGLYVDGVLAWFSAGALQSPDGITISASGDMVLGQGVSGEPSLSAQMSEFQLWHAVLSPEAIMTGLQVRAANNSGAQPLWALTSPATSGTVVGGSFAVSNPALRFRSAPALTASWTVASPPPAISYDLQVTSSDNTYHAPQTTSSTSATVPDPQVNVTYTAQVRSVVSGTTGDWSQPASTLTLDLGQPLPGFVTAPNPPFLLSWPQVDQAQQYQLSFLKNGTQTVPPSGNQTGTNVDVTTLVQDTANTYSFSIASAALGSTSPASATQTITQPELTFTFTDVSTSTGQLLAGWNNSDGAADRYLKIAKAGATVVEAVLGGQTLSYTVQVTPAEGDTYTAQLRSLTSGHIGPVSSQVAVTVHYLNGPVIGTVTADGGAHTLAVPWSFTPPAGVSPTFELQLWNSDETQMVTSVAPAVSPQSVSNAAITEGANLNLRVRAFADNSYGLWSQWMPVAVGAVPKVTGVSANPDIYGNVTVNWSSVLAQNPLLQGVSYTVTLTGSGISTYQLTGITGLTASLAQSQTHVQANNTYTITVMASAQGKSDGPASDPVSVTIGTIQPFPPGQPGASKDPVDLAAGAFLYQSDDLVVAGVVPLIFTTSYSSSRPTSGENPLYPQSVLGNRWSHRYATALRRDSQNAFIYLIWGLTGVERYQIPASVTGVYSGAGAVPGSHLSLGGDMVFTLTRADRTRYLFDFSGKLLNVFDQYGNQSVLAYDAQSRLLTINDPQSGHTLTLTYATATVSVSDGARTVVYTVSSGNLSQFTNARGHNRKFNYVSGASALIETIVDFNGLTAVKNTYTNGQVAFQQDGRSLQAGASYGTTFSFTPATVGDGVAGVNTVMTDRAGNQASYLSVGGNGNLLSEVYNVNATEIYAVSRNYDGFNNLLSSTEYRGPSAGFTSGMGNTLTCTYDDAGNRLTTIMPLAPGMIAALANTYDSSNNMLTQAYYEGSQQGYTPGMGNVTTWTYNSDNTMATMTLPLSSPVVYEYQPGNIRGLVNAITDALGNPWTLTYYANGLPQTVTDPYGNVTTYQWDSLGRMQQDEVAGPDRTALRTRMFAYNENNQVTSISTWFNGQTRTQAFSYIFQYDNNGNVHSVTDPTGVIATYDYDANNNRTSLEWPVFGQITRVTGWSYDHNDFLNGTTWSAANPLVRASYINDAIGVRTQRTDPKGMVYLYSSTMAAQMGPAPLVKTKTWPPLPDQVGEVTASDTFDPLGRPVSSTDRNGNTTAIAWGMNTDTDTHAQQQVITVTLPKADQQSPAETIQTIFDALGRPVQYTDQASKVWRWTYQKTAGPGNRNVLVATGSDPLGNQTIVSTDSYGRTLIEKRGGGALWLVRQYTYDALGRLIQVVESDNTAANTETTKYSYAYDAASSFMTVTAGRTGADNLTTGVTVQYYNGRGDLIKQSNPFGQPVTQTYTPWGGPASYSNGRGQTFTYVFDAAGRRSGITGPPDLSVIYTLDANGNRLATTARQQNITCGFDPWNRLTSRRDANGRSTGYAYKPGDQVRTLTYPDEKTVRYCYDGLSRLTTATDWAGRKTCYSYSPTGLLTGITFLNAAATAIAGSTFNFDDAGVPTGYSHTSGGFVLAQATFQLNALSQPTQGSAILALPPTLSSGDQTFTYGDGNQLATINAVSQASDNDGNFIGPTGQAAVAAYDAYGRIIGFNGDSYSYDADGLRATTTIAGVQQSYTFDIRGWQSPQVQRGDPSRGLESAVNLPGVSGSNTWLLMDPNTHSPLALSAASDHLLEVYDSNGNLIVRYVHGQGLIGGEDSTGYYTIALTDTTGTVLARVGQDGVVQGRYAYDPYGASLGSISTGYNPFGYNGRDGVLDDGNGLLSMRSRNYASSQMRFLQPDYFLGGIGRPQTLNRYAFAMGNPLQANDPLGLATVAIVVVSVLGGAAVLGIIGYFIYNAAAGGAGGAVAGGADGLGDYELVNLNEDASGSGEAGEESASPEDSGSNPNVPLLGPGQSATLSDGSVLTRRLTSASRATARTNVISNKINYGRVKSE